MGEDTADKRTPARQYETACEQILRVARAHADHHQLGYDDAEDCAMGFLTATLLRQNVRTLRSGDLDEEAMRKTADSWARRFAYRRSRRARKEIPLSGPDGREETGPAAVLVSPEPGPEEVAHSADMMERLLAPLLQLTPVQQRLFVQRFLEQARMVDLQEETGRSANALGRAVFAIRKRMRSLLEGQGIDATEVSDFLNLLDRLRSSQES